jgi:MFS family permease
VLHGFAFAIFYTLVGIPIGRLADRHSRRVIAAAGIAVWSFMTAVCGIARGYWELFTARVGVGVGEAALSPAAFSMIADLFPPQKLGRALSVYTMGAFIGAGLAFIIGGAVIQTITSSPEMTLPIVGTIRSWQATFFIVGLPGLVVAALMFTVTEPVRRIKTSTVTDSQVDDVVPIREVIGYVVRRWPVYGSHFLGFALLAIVSNGVFAWAPAFLNRSFGMSVGEAGPAIGIVILIFCTAGLFVGGWLTDYWVRRGFTDGAMRAGVVAGIGCIPFAVLVPFMPSVTSVLVIYAPLLFFSSFGFGAAAAAVQQVTPNRMRGLVSALYLFVLNLLGIGFGPTITALITDYGFGDDQALGYSLGIMASVAGLLAAIVLWLGLKPFRAEVAAQSK